jgi:hypothetical protein
MALLKAHPRMIHGLAVDHIDWRWPEYGAVADNLTNCKAAFDAAFAAAKASGRPLFLGSGRFHISSNLNQMVVADQTDVLIYGAGRDVCYIRFSTSCTKGLDFSSTTITANALPRFELRGVTLTTSAENIGPALKCAWAINTDIEDPFSLEDVTIQGDIRQLADDASDYGYWSGGVLLSNCRNSSINEFRFTGEMDRASNKTAYAFKLQGECTSFTISHGLILEAEKGIVVDGATEGLYIHATDIVSVNIGIEYNPSGALEPQVVFTAGHIAAMQVAIDLYDLRYFRVSDSFFLGKSGFGSHNASQNWIGVRVSGSLSGWGVIDAEFSKEDGHGSGGATSTAVSIVNGDGIEVRGSVHAYDAADPIDYGVRFASGVTRSYANIQTRNVTTDYDFTAANGNTVIRRNAAEMQVLGGSNQYLTILGAAAAYLKLYDSGGGLNLKEARLLCDGGVVQILQINDDGTTKTTPLSIDVSGNVTLRPGASITPAANGDLTIEATNNTTATIKLKGSDGVVRSGTVTLS